MAPMRRVRAGIYSPGLWGISVDWCAGRLTFSFIKPWLEFDFRRKVGTL